MASGLGPHVRELKIGQSFLKKKGAGGRKAPMDTFDHPSSFHTIRYDFKPASVDPNRTGQLKVAEDNKAVSVNIPNLDGNQTTNYGGHIKEANKKDCVLIIDHETGEITIERLTNQVLVKKTRPEKIDKSETSKQLQIPSSNGNHSGSRPSTPFDQMMRKSAKNSPASHKSNSPNSLPGSSAFSNRSLNGSRSNSPSFFHQNTATYSSNPRHNFSSAHQDGFSGIGIDEMLPDFSLPDARNTEVPPSSDPPASSNLAETDLGLSDSSTSDSSSDSDDSDDSDDQVSQGSKPVSFTKGGSPTKSAPSMPSDLLMMDSTSDSKPKSSINSFRDIPKPSAALSMPQMLNDDLQLSESDDSSDDDL